LWEVALSDEPDYEALSYTWGDSSDKCPSYCEGQTLKVTRNLHSALRHLRHDTAERILWVDAVCIDQDNEQERSQQMPLMGKIYGNAQQVVVWLGEETQHVRKSFETIEKLHIFLLQNEQGYPDDPRRFQKLSLDPGPVAQQLLAIKDMWISPFEQLMVRPWFTRQWVIQEAARASRATVICGYKALSWEKLANVYWSILNSGVLFYICGPESALRGKDISTLANMELCRRDLINDKGTPLLELIVSARVFQRTNPRDAIYSLLGLALDCEAYGDSIKPKDSLPVTDVFRKFVVGCIKQKDSLRFLSAPYVPTEKSSHLDLPSWVPDFSNLATVPPLMYMRNETGLPFHASGYFKQQVRLSDDERILYVVGKEIDVISKIGYAPEELPTAPFPQRKRGKWISHSKQLVFGNTWYTAGGRFEEFWRTMLCNLTSDGERPPPEFCYYFLEDQEFYFQYNSVIPKHSQQAFMLKMLKVELAIDSRSRGWRVCATRDRRIGRVLYSAKVGDVICVLYGGEVPYVIRPCGNGLYKFIGACYVHGLMDGEALQLPSLPSKEFAFF
jgi:hypothetical protein